MDTPAQETNVAPMVEEVDVKTDSSASATSTTVTPVDTTAEKSHVLTDQTRYLPRRKIITVRLLSYCRRSKLPKSANYLLDQKWGLITVE